METVKQTPRCAKTNGVAMYFGDFAGRYLFTRYRAGGCLPG